MSAQSLLHWHLRLRWFAFFGQLLVLGLSAVVFELSLPYGWLLLLLLIIPVTNFLGGFKCTSRISENCLLGSFLVLDTFVLTGLLALSGGPTNPFSIVYLLHVVLAAVMLGERWSWGIAGLSLSCFSCLFWLNRPVPEWHVHGSHQGFSLHLHGMLFAFAVVAMSAVYFLSRIVRELRRAERRLEQLENVSQSAQRLTSVAALTAHAAHELGSPLGTIHLVAHELAKGVEKSGLSERVREDLAILKSEAERCREILGDLAARTGESMGESAQVVDVHSILQELSESFGEDAKRVKLRVGKGGFYLWVPLNSLRAALSGLVHNALEASAHNGTEVVCSCDVNEELVVFEILDSGVGISDEVLARVGEPFFSTKGNRGMGLGVYAARLTAEQLGGSLKLERRDPCGTRVSFSFPRLEIPTRKVA